MLGDVGSERVTGRKARGLQTEEIGCKCQTFVISLKRQEETSDFFFPLLYTNLKEKAMASHSSALAWNIPWTEEPDGLQSV